MNGGSEMENEFGGLFNIEVDSADETEEAKVPRDFQSQEDFERQKASWVPKTEEGMLWKQVKLPMDKPSKIESQILLHAIEELYFCKRYPEAKDLVIEALKGNLSDEFRPVVVKYGDRCDAKLRIAKT